MPGVINQVTNQPFTVKKAKLVSEQKGKKSV